MNTKFILIQTYNAPTYVSIWNRNRTEEFQKVMKLTVTRYRRNGRKKMSQLLCKLIKCMLAMLIFYTLSFLLDKNFATCRHKIKVELKLYCYMTKSTVQHNKLRGKSLIQLNNKKKSD